MGALVAITNYSSLQAAVLSWLRRGTDPDTVAQVPTFIALAEVNIKAELQARGLEAEVALTATRNSRFIALPTDFIGPLGLWRTDDNPRTRIIAKLPQDLAVTTFAGDPNYYAIDGSNIAFERPVDGSLNYSFRYMQDIGLSDSNPTNWILTRYPNVYLYGALLETAPFLNNAARLPEWEALYSRAMSKAKRIENKSRRLAVMKTEIAGITSKYWYSDDQSFATPQGQTVWDDGQTIWDPL